MTEDKLPQLKCKICETKRLLTEEEIKESINIMNKHNMVKNQILELWSTLEGATCPEGGNHEYMWNPTFRENIMNDADKRRNNEAEIVRNNNKNEELNVEIEKIKQETEQKIKELTENKDDKIKELQEKIKKNQETNVELETLNPTLEENILKTSGRDYKQWL